MRDTPRSEYARKAGKKCQTSAFISLPATVCQSYICHIYNACGLTIVSRPGLGRQIL